MDCKYCKNLYKISNRAILKNAEEIYGNFLPQDENLPHLTCRPCERKLDNAMQFTKIIVETQQTKKKSLEQDSLTKCCVGSRQAS